MPDFMPALDVCLEFSCLTSRLCSRTVARQAMRRRYAGSQGFHVGNLQRLLLLSAILADEFDAGFASGGLHAVGRAAFAAHLLDPGVALFHDKVLLFHRLADQALGLLAHRWL